MVDRTKNEGQEIMSLGRRISGIFSSTVCCLTFGKPHQFRKTGEKCMNFLKCLRNFLIENVFAVFPLLLAVLGWMPDQKKVQIRDWGALVFVVALALIVLAQADYSQTGLIPKFSSFIASGVFLTVASLLWITGLKLDTINQNHRHRCELCLTTSRSGGGDSAGFDRGGRQGPDI